MSVNQLLLKTRKIQEHKHAMCTLADPHPMPLLDQAQPAAHRVTESLHLRQVKYAQKLLYVSWEIKILYVCIKIFSGHLLLMMECRIQKKIIAFSMNLWCSCSHPNCNQAKHKTQQHKHITFQNQCSNPYKTHNFCMQVGKQKFCMYA